MVFRYQQQGGFSKSWKKNKAHVRYKNYIEAWVGVNNNYYREYWRHDQSEGRSSFFLFIEFISLLEKIT